MLSFGFVMLPLEIPLSLCHSLSYALAVANFFFKESLAIFLLWRLRQIENRESDKWISLVLLFIRTIAQITQMALSKPDIFFDGGIQSCNPNPNSAKVAVWTVIGCDMLIEIYVTVRLVKILKRANRNAAQIRSNMDRKTKRTLFTAVIYWNFLRLAVVFVTSTLSSIYIEIIPSSSFTHQAIDKGIFSAFTIIMSYVITVDAEIVRVVEGKYKKGSNNSNSEKSIPGTPHVPSAYHKKKTSQTLPKYTSSIEQEESDDAFITSMKRLSFFEWANMVVGFRRDKNNNERNFNEEDIEEIVEGPSDATNNDIERGFNQINDKRRSSNFSNSTIVTTLASTVKERDFA
ncbi:2029_t:CDS:2 [Funneliformis caledonium]|uniref:2029_t:CDS:1 n=1 Tax=Funneliformis caledonium TaxID=1117310 RepID=A0A9N9D8K6_9GLOM|nr:2029_t:CDS:2 [Funneliformis caledonium]